MQSSPDAVLNMDPSTEWFKLNTNQSGFYRVNYDESNWRKLVSQPLRRRVRVTNSEHTLCHTLRLHLQIDLLHSHDYNQHVLSPTDRAGLIDDAFSLMKISLLTADLALNLSSYLESGERDYVPWETALRHFAALDVIMDGNPYLHKYVLKLLQPSLTVWGWKDDGTHLERKLRVAALKAAVRYGDEQTIRFARRFFEGTCCIVRMRPPPFTAPVVLLFTIVEWMKNNYKVAPNFRYVVYATGVRYGTSREWDFCWKKYKNSRIPSEQRLLLSALAATRNPWLLERLLGYALDREKIKPQDTVQVITDVARNAAGRLLVWRFVRANWDKVLELFGQGSFSMDSIISETSWHFSREFDYQEVSQFFKSVGVGPGQQAVHQSLERIRANIYWKTHIEQHVVKWLQKVTYRL